MSKCAVRITIALALLAVVSVVALLLLTSVEWRSN